MLDAKDAVELLAQRMDAFNDLWRFYLTIVLALMGILASQHNSIKGILGVFLAIGFWIFGAANTYELYSVIRQYRALYVPTHDILAKAHISQDVFAPIDPWWIVSGHLLFDLAIVAVVLAAAFDRLPAWKTGNSEN